MDSEKALSCFSCCWKDVRLKHTFSSIPYLRQLRFSCCWKDVRLKPDFRFLFLVHNVSFSCCWKDVRLKRLNVSHFAPFFLFQLLLKGCTIEAGMKFFFCSHVSFVSVVVERMYDWSIVFYEVLGKHSHVSVVVERMYDWSREWSAVRRRIKSFSCCWKDVRLKLQSI